MGDFCYGVGADELVHDCAGLVAHGAVGGIGEGPIDGVSEGVDETLVEDARDCAQKMLYLLLTAVCINIGTSPKFLK